MMRSRIVFFTSLMDPQPLDYEHSKNLGILSKIWMERIDWFGEDGVDRSCAVVYRDVTRAAPVLDVPWLLMEPVSHEIHRRSLVGSIVKQRVKEIVSIVSSTCKGLKPL
ncbi:hypothetical protein LguiA_018076 [Lonicera macranthoides]